MCNCSHPKQQVVVTVIAFVPAFQYKYTKHFAPLRPKLILEATVTFHTTDPTLSPSPLKMLCRRIVDHHTLPVVCSLCPSRQFPYQPESSGTLLYAKTPLPYLWHFTCQWTPLNTCIITQHLGVQSHMEQIPYVQFPLPHVCFIIPHVTSHYSTCYFQIFHMLVALHYLSCFIPSVYKL